MGDDALWINGIDAVIELVANAGVCVETLDDAETSSVLSSNIKMQINKLSLFDQLKTRLTIKAKIIVRRSAD